MAKISELTISKEAMKEKLKRAVFEVGGPIKAAELWSDDEWKISASYIRQAMTSQHVLPSKALCDKVDYEPVKEIKYRYRRVR